MVIEKQVEFSPERLYTIFIIQDNVVTLQQAISYTNSPTKVEISLAEMIENWGVSKSEPPISMMEAPALPTSISLELRKLEVLKAIVALHEKLSKKATPLAFYRRPDEVRTTTHVKSGTLVLTPLCSVAQISTKNTSSNTGVSLGTENGVELFALPVIKPSINKDAPATWPEHAMVSPFWWVGTVQNKTDANMDFTTITQNGIEVPVLSSVSDIPAHTRLVYFVKPKAKTEPLQNAIKGADGGDAATRTRDAQAKKKQRR